MTVMDQKLRTHWPKKGHMRQLEALEMAGCVTVGDVLNDRMTEAEMLRIPIVGRGTLFTVKGAVLKAIVDWSYRF